jgi:hypothetical protein
LAEEEEEEEEEEALHSSYYWYLPMVRQGRRNYDNMLLSQYTHQG